MVLRFAVSDTDQRAAAAVSAAILLPYSCLLLFKIPLGEAGVTENGIKMITSWSHEEQQTDK